MRKSYALKKRPPMGKWGDPRLVNNAFRNNPGLGPKSSEDTKENANATTAEKHKKYPTSKARSVRDAFVDFARDQKTNVFLTLALSPRASYVSAQTQIDKFFVQIMQKTYGRNWRHIPGDLRPVALGFLEHVNSNRHYHLVVRANADVHYALLTQGEAIWRRLMTHGDIHVQIMRSEDAVIGYSLKEQIKLTNFESVYVLKF